MSRSERMYKKKVVKKMCWLVIYLAVAVSFVALLLYRPSHYHPPKYVNSNQISPYLTHELLPKLYNHVQYDQPFELIITQAGVSGVLAQSRWPRESDGAVFYTPQIFFTNDEIIVMGTVLIGMVKFVVTILIVPELDEQGFLNLRVIKVKIGAINTTLMAKSIAKRIFRQKIAPNKTTSENIKTKIAASLLIGQPFAPIFEIKDRKVRVTEIKVLNEKLCIKLSPAI